MNKLSLSAIAFTSLFTTGLQAQTTEKLNLLCAADQIWCELLTTEFTKAHPNINVAMIRKSSGEAYAQLRAESRNPRLDVWWGGTGDPHLQAAAEDLTAEYRSPQLSELYPWAQDQAKSANYRTVGVYSGVLGFGYNSDLLAKKGLPTPKCWKDLADPAYKNEIQMANPNSSGTAYTILATLVQLLGEEAAFDYMKNLHKNINQYTTSGSAPIKNAAAGETTIGIVFLHDALTQKQSGFPIEIVAPCEGTGYEVGSMSIVKGAKNRKNAEIWAEWVLSPTAQNMAELASSYQIPSNSLSIIPDDAIKMEDINLITYDFAHYGSIEVRRNLLARWDKEVKGGK